MTSRSDSHASQLVIGIDVGGTNMQYGVVDAQNTIVGRAKLKTKAADGAEAVVGRMVKGMHEACEDAAVRWEDIEAIGVAAAGAIDIPRGVILNAPNLGWLDLPLRAMLEERTDKCIVLENDVNGAVWGEYNLGACRGEGDVLGVWVGTGVGGGLVLNGTIYHGSHFTAGEIGLTVLDVRGANGMRRLEEICSRTGMSRTIVHRLHTYRDSMLNDLITKKSGIAGSKALAKAYNAQDELAVDVVNEAAHLLGYAIANFVSVLALDRVILGGGVTEALGEPYVKRVRAAYEEVVFPPQLAGKCEIVPTELEDNAGLLGAALLAREALPALQNV